MDFNDERSLDPRIDAYIQAARQMQSGNFRVEIPIEREDTIGQLGRMLSQLAISLDQRYQEFARIDQITMEINSGLLLDEILDKIYRDFQVLIPYDRIGLALLEDNGARVTAHWARSSSHEIHITRGYTAAMTGSSLQNIMKTGEARIINDLEAYLNDKPNSQATRDIIAEGMRSSLTCPLAANDIPVGFLFFSSKQPNTYTEHHIKIFRRIANQVAVIVEKGKLVSELAQQKMKIEQQNQELKRLNEMRNTFLGMAAHDLRNPISTIQLAANLLVMEEPKHGQPDSVVNEILNQTEHMLELLNDLLDVTNIEAGKLDLRREPVELYPYLEHIISHHRQVAATKNMTVTLEVPIRSQVHVDPQRMRQVIDNLISNAIKYSPPGADITILSCLDEKTWRVDVIDQGPGISEQDQELLFQHFSRLAIKPTGGESSTGLGLAIARRIVEAHDGTIGIQSEPGSGSCFWFQVPVTG
jgi:signal transduction histidine kinase